MTEMEQYIEEYGVPAPVPEDYESGEAYQAAYDAWLAGFAAFMFRKADEEEAARIAEEEEAARRQAEEEEAARQAREEEEVRAAQSIQTPETEDRYPVGSYVDVNGEVWSPSGELLPPETGGTYPSHVYVDPAGNLWSESGELLSPGTTPAMEPEVDELAGEVVGEPVTGDPTIDTALLLLDLFDALTGEEGMTSDVDGIQVAVEGIQQALDHPLMTTSFQDYNVTEGLLLLLLLSAFIAACAKMLKGGFSWLR